MNKRFISLFILILFSLSYIFAVSIEEANGPFILTDFDFNKVYENSANVDFYCLASQNYATSCIIQSQYEIDGIKFDFNFNEYVLFNFNGTKEITVYAKNDINKTTTKTFVLTINNPSSTTTTPQTPSTPTSSTTNPSNSTGGSTGSYVPPLNTPSSTTTTTTPQEDSVSDQVISTPINPEGNLNLEENEILTNIEINRGTAYLTLPFAFEQKHGIFIGLVAVVIILSIALVIIPKKVKKWKNILF